MGRVKDEMLQAQELEFELELSYQEWMRDNLQEPSEHELDEMEQDFQKKPHFGKNRIITQGALNNTDYNQMEEQL